MAMKNIKIRQITQNDALFLQQLMNNDQVMTILNEAPTSVDFWADAIIGWDSDPDEEDYIILDEGTQIGWLGINGLSSENKQAFIKVIALLPTHQVHGIGQYVINEITKNLHLRGLTSLGLYTDCSNERAQHCYNRCGFELSEKTVQKMPNGTIVNRYKMERSL
ncbi:MAG: GNAT family N-acetyltransferase [Armatimonadota bacterium]